jgi:hypothetical protein
LRRQGRLFSEDKCGDPVGYLHFCLDFQFSSCARDFALLRVFLVPSGTHPASWFQDTAGPFPLVNRPACDVDHSPPSCAQLRMITAIHLCSFVHSLHFYISVLSIKGPIRRIIYFHFISTNNLYMFRALFCSTSGGAVCTAVGIFMCVLCRLAACRVGVELVSDIYYDAR